MKRLLSLILLAAVFFAAPAFAADPIVGSWTLNVAKSKFADKALTGGTRVYTEANGLYTLDQKLTGADGKEKSNHAQYRDGKEEKQAPGGTSDATVAKKIDADRKSTRLNSSHSQISYAVFCLKKKKTTQCVPQI